MSGPLCKCGKQLQSNINCTRATCNNCGRSWRWFRSDYANDWAEVDGPVALVGKMTAERDAAIARAERAEKAHAEAVKLLIRARKITDNWGHLDPGECDRWENQIDNHLRKHKEAGK